MVNKALIIKDNNGNDYIVKNATLFLEHIKLFHNKGKSLHEENGHYFSIDDSFRTNLKKSINDIKD